MSKLKSLDVSYSPITITQLEHLLLAAPNLETLYLSSCKHFNKENFSSLQSKCLSKLKSLRLSCSSITITQLEQLLLAAPNIETLDLSGCHHFNKENFNSLQSKWLSKLKSLDLSYSSITTAQLEHLLHTAPNLETLNLSYCTSFNTETLSSLQSKCLSKLKSLDLTRSSITSVQVEHLLRAAPNLETLKLNECKSFGMGGAFLSLIQDT